MDGGLIGLLITVIIVGIVFSLLWWLVGYIALPAPFDKVARVIIALIAVIWLLDALFGIAGGSTRLRLR